MPTDISNLIGPWEHYELSADGKELTLVAGGRRAQFLGIVCMSLRPAARQEQGDTDKEITAAISYRLTDHRVPRAPSASALRGTAVEIGPLHLRVYFEAHWDTVRRLRGFHVAGDYFSVTLICRECRVSAA